LKAPSAGRVFLAKAQRSGANDGDACGCHDPLEGVVAATLSALGLRVKTLDLVVSMTAVLLVSLTSRIFRCRSIVAKTHYYPAHLWLIRQLPLGIQVRV
jgi:hypothetical protein